MIMASILIPTLPSKVQIQNGLDSDEQPHCNLYSSSPPGSVEHYGWLNPSKTLKKSGFLDIKR